jgi:hypothetical protein
MFPAFLGFMDQFTPELERRLQVEELWARRNVLADSMNVCRLERFREQYSLLTHFGTKGQRVPSRDTPHTLAGLQDKSAAPLGLRPAVSPNLPAASAARRVWWIGAPALAAVILVLAAADPLQGKAVIPGAAFHALLSGPLQTAQPNVVGPAPRADVALSQHDLPDLRAQVAAEIAASMGHRAHSPEILRALQSTQSRSNAMDQ